MPTFANNAVNAGIQTDSESAVYSRILYAMAVTVGLSVLVSLFFAPWRVTTGLLLGGLLSLLSYYWMSSSIASAFNVTSGVRPQIKLATYVLRYFVITVVVYAAYKLRIISLPATILALCSFVAGLFAEAFRGFYLTIVHREETS